MVPRRYVKVTIKRANNVNACTFLKARTLVTAKASFKNLAFTTNRVEDMGQNPVWVEDGTSVFYFDFGNSSEFITLELFNRDNKLIGTSKLYFSHLEYLPSGKPAEMTLPVMVSSNNQSGELILEAEILAQQAMGERGLLTIQIKKGHVKKIISVLRAKTAKVKAKLTYKHTTFTSGVLENAGNSFVWQADNVFTFMINSDVKVELDVLKIEIFNVDTKVGECEMRMSLFLEDNDCRGVSNGFVMHTTDLSHPNKPAVVGNIEVGAKFQRNTSFFPNPVSVSQGSSSPWTPHVHPQVVHKGIPTTHHTFPPVVDNAFPTTQPVFYPTVHVNAGSQCVQESSHNPSAPPMNQHPPWGGPAARQPSYQQPSYQQPPYQQPPYQQPPYQQPPAIHQQPAAGAPAGPSFQRDFEDVGMMNYINSFH